MSEQQAIEVMEYFNAEHEESRERFCPKKRRPPEKSHVFGMSETHFFLYCKECEGLYGYARRFNGNEKATGWGHEWFEITS